MKKRQNHHQVFLIVLYLFIQLCWVLVVACRFLTRDQTRGPLHLELRVLATGPPGKSYHQFIFLGGLGLVNPHLWLSFKLVYISQIAKLMYLSMHNSYYPDSNIQYIHIWPLYLIIISLLASNFLKGGNDTPFSSLQQ